MSIVFDLRKSKAQVSGGGDLHGGFGIKDMDGLIDKYILSAKSQFGDTVEFKSGSAFCRTFKNKEDDMLFSMVVLADGMSAGLY